MKPYYDDGMATIYHGDCREILPTIDSAAVVVTDPPYGIGLDTNYSRFRDSERGVRGHGHLRRSHPPVVGDSESFDPTALLRFSEVITWGANNYAANLPRGAWLVWDKRADNGHAMLSDAELAWWSRGRMVKLFDHCWHGFARASENSEHYHPTQKPVELMQWCILLLKSDGVILDPYMGSGTTLRAAKNVSRRALGIEIQEAYCEIAARRLEQGVLDFGGVA